MHYEEEIPRNQRMKRSKAKPPKKSKHKHVYEPCILEFNKPSYDRERGQIWIPGSSFASYCPICGKVGEPDYERWWTKEAGILGRFEFFKDVYTEEAEREMNPETRTLPTFWADDWLFQKFVDIEGRD